MKEVWLKPVTMQKMISVSREALHTVNPIRQCTENHFVDAMRRCKKDLIKVSVGEY